ncbi:MAG: LysR family transcriptional regulator [Chloroflexi bacterium]|nr:LysR family transcriptional regulator [Chloroflexota bacterium]
MIDLGQLEAFLQVAEHSSFSRAAEALFLTQPTISARIHALERELGELLFERSSRSVRLTEAGQTFLPYAKRALEVYREGRTALDSLRQAQGGRLRLGASRVFGTYLLPDILHVFKQRHPGVSLSVRTARSAQMLELLLAGEIDLGLTRYIDHDEIVTVKLAEDPVYLAVHPDDLLASVEEMPLRSLVREPLILYEPDSSYYSLILSLCRDAGITPDIFMELDEIEGAKQMVARGLGVSILPLCAMRAELEQGLLKAIPLKGDPRSTPICLVYRRRTQASYLIDAFVRVASELFPEGKEPAPLLPPPRTSS